MGPPGESLAAGVVFTLPSPIFLLPLGPAYFNYAQIIMLAVAGAAHRAHERVGHQRAS